MFFEDQDPYAVLGVATAADHDSIRSAYRALARRYHPDVATSAWARQRMIEVNRAWEILGDPARRAVHDRRVRWGGGGPNEADRPPTPPRGGAQKPAWVVRQAARGRPVG